MERLKHIGNPIYYGQVIQVILVIVMYSLPDMNSAVGDCVYVTG